MPAEGAEMQAPIELPDLAADFRQRVRAFRRRCIANRKVA
jgi:hypothetical protein